MDPLCALGICLVQHFLIIEVVSGLNGGNYGIMGIGKKEVQKNCQDEIRHDCTTFKTNKIPYIYAMYFNSNRSL